VVAGVPFGILNRRGIDKAMETDNGTFGHWATVRPPVRRLTNIHRSASSRFRRAASLRDRLIRRHHGHTAQGCHGQIGDVSPGRTQPSHTSSVRRTGLDSIPQSTLETIGWLDFEHQQEKTLRRRGQLLELGRAAWAGGEMVEQCRLFSSVEYPSGQLGEVCFESFVRGYPWANHRETTAKSAVRDCCFLVAG
jgi:hypothetical protein